MDELSGEKQKHSSQSRQPHHRGRFIDTKTGKPIEFDDDEYDEEDEDEEDDDTRRAYSPLAHLMSLLHVLLKAGVLLVFGGLVTYLVVMGGQTVAAVIITALVMAVVWLTAVVSQRG